MVHRTSFYCSKISPIDISRQGGHASSILMKYENVPGV